MKKKILTPVAGKHYLENEESMTAGPRAQVLLQDITFIKTLTPDAM